MPLTAKQLPPYYEFGPMPAPGGGNPEYLALATQTGTNDPTITILKNTLGITINWTRIAPGIYQGQSTGNFPLANTYISAICGGFTCTSTLARRQDIDNVWYLTVHDTTPTDGETTFIQVIIIP